jgi:AcrR family transcriptional regulator
MVRPPSRRLGIMTISLETSEKSAQPPKRRRSEILDTAARVFYERGYGSTSMQEIADAVGILKGSLYYYIESKEDLLWEILKSVHIEAMRNVQETEALGGTALQKLRAFLTSHVMFNAENLIKTGVFFHDFQLLSVRRRAEIVVERDAYECFLRGLVEQGQAEGDVCPDLDPKLVTLGMLGMMNWIHHWYRKGGESSPTRIAGEYADFLIAGIACDPATHRSGHRGRQGAGVIVTRR